MSDEEKCSEAFCCMCVRMSKNLIFHQFSISIDKVTSSLEGHDSVISFPGALIIIKNIIRIFNDIMKKKEGKCM